MDIVGVRDYSDDGRASVRRYGFRCQEHFTLGGKCCRYADILSPCSLTTSPSLWKIPAVCGDEGGVSSLRDGRVLSGLTPDLQ